MSHTFFSISVCMTVSFFILCRQSNFNNLYYEVVAAYVTRVSLEVSLIMAKSETVIFVILYLLNFNNSLKVMFFQIA